MTIGELVIELGFSADTKVLNDFGRAVGNLNLNSIATALGLGALYEATNKIMNVADQTAMSLWGFNQVTGVSQKQTQQFSNVVEQLGGNAQDAQGSLKNLQTAMLNVQLGRGNAEPFILTGIDPSTRNVFEVLEKLQTFLKTSRASDSVKRMIVSEFGLAESMIPVLKNAKDINKAMDEFITNSPEQEQALVRSHAAWAKLDNEWRVVLTDIGGELAPLFEGTANALDYLAEVIHKYPELNQILLALAIMFGVVTAAIVGMSLAMVAVAIAGWISGLSEVALLVGSIAAGLAMITMNLDKIPKLAHLATTFANASEFPLIGVGMAAHLVGAATGNRTITNDIDFVVSGVLDPERAGEIAAKKLQKILTDRYYHEPTQSR